LLVNEKRVEKMIAFEHRLLPKLDKRMIALSVSFKNIIARKEKA